MLRRNARGVAFIELMALLSVLTAVMAVSTYIIVHANVTARQAARSKITVERFDAMTDHLRRDVWGSSSITTPSASTLELAIGEKTISWTIENGRVTRAQGTEPARNWDGMPAIEFSAARGVLKLHIADPAESADIFLPSQLLLAGGTK